MTNDVLTPISRSFDHSAQVVSVQMNIDVRGTKNREALDAEIAKRGGAIPATVSIGNEQHSVTLNRTDEYVCVRDGATHRTLGMHAPLKFSFADMQALDKTGGRYTLLVDGIPADRWCETLGAGTAATGV